MGSGAPDIERLEGKLGWTFHDRALLRQALTHPSYVKQHPEEEPHNQRLEFLGDAVLGMLLAETVFHAFPLEREGVLTRNRAALAHGLQLARLARDLDVPEFLRLADAEELLLARERDSILEDALESLIGAAYLDGGLDAARAVTQRIYGDFRRLLDEASLARQNPKGQLQERLQAGKDGGPSIRYEVVSHRGPDHAKEFEARVLIDTVEYGRGWGSSKKEAEETAARIALETYPTAEPKA